jgi:hypothetical protein
VSGPRRWRARAGLAGPVANFRRLVPASPRCDHGRVRTKIGKDGKSYPAQMPPPRPWRWEVIKLTHHLAHEIGLSERLTVLALAERGYRRSAGSVHYDLTRLMPTCVRCCPPERGDRLLPGSASGLAVAGSRHAAPAGRA